MVEEKEISNGWRHLRLGEVYDFEYGKALKKEDRNQSGIYPVHGSNGEVGKHDKFLVQGPGIVVGRKGSAGEVSYVNSNFWAIDTTYYIKTKISCSIKFSYYLLKSLSLNQLDKSTAIPGLNRNDAYNKQISLPSFQEQEQIVSKIEELFSELDKGIEQLKTAQQQLKVYRQSILKWAFEGIGKKVRLNEIAEKIQIGPFGSQLHKEDYIIDGIPLINPMHIQDGKIEADYSYSILKAKRDSLPNYILKNGDVIMGRRGEMARCGLVTKKEDGWFCGTGSLFVRPNKNVFSGFLYYQLRSETIKKYLEDNAAGTTMTNLNSKIVNNIPVNIPSYEEQKQIVQEIESRLSVADKLEETIKNSLQHAEALRQSILKKAFEGKLF
jgi:type I restriction enzyme S subunit